MAAKEIAKDKYLCTEGQALDSIHIIVSGSVKATFPGGEIVLKKGDVLGLCDIAYDSHFFTYSTLETSAFISFPLKTKDAIKDIVRVNPEIGKMLHNSMLSQVASLLSLYSVMKVLCGNLYKNITSSYDVYLDIANRNNVISRSLPQLEEISPLTLDDEPGDWMPDYYESLRSLPIEVKNAMAEKTPYLIGFLYKASADIHSIFSACEAMKDYCDDSCTIFLQENHLDFFDLFSGLLLRLKPKTPDFEKLSKMMEEMIDHVKKSPGIDSDLCSDRVSEYRLKMQTLSDNGAQQNTAIDSSISKELVDSLNKIIEYSGCEEDITTAFKKYVQQYKKLSDMNSTDDNVRKLRMDLTKCFYKIYASAFTISLHDHNLPIYMRMFFNFGYVDEELAGAENAAFLYDACMNYSGDPSYGVYTIYEWLRAVYDMKKDPSRNEFDTDYLSYIHEQKVTGKISPETESRLVNDPSQRVMFEIENMFPLVNKVTYGRLSTFTPIFSEQNVLKPLNSCLVTVDSIVDCLGQINAIDYGAFYRETVYTNEACGIPKEFIDVKIMPDVILTPNIGTRGVMWQEIEGRKRTTPARFMVSILHMEDLLSTFVRMVGEYRWEMCKRVQGARWNDVSDRSLTSEYFDYIQFYRKNNDLSADAKEKIKVSLVKAKNSFKEMFVRDYIIWVLFEGNGSPRLNKIVRGIMCTYCPFPKETREKMMANPLFKELLERYNIKVNQNIHHFDNVIQKLKNQNVSVPPELMVHRKYLEGN